MNKYLAWDAINGDHETFKTLKEAQDYLTECFLCDGEYSPDIESFCIYELHTGVTYDLIDSKENYKYMHEDEIPEGDEDSEAWPYPTDHDEIWQHKFVDLREGQKDEVTS